MSKHELWELQSMQAASLSTKIAMTKQRIREWVNHYGEDGVYVSFSGGKDSTVLLHLVREMYPDIPAVFVDVPTQFPELKKFAETFNNVVVLKSRISFYEVCEKYGFPLISKEISGIVGGAQKTIRLLEQQGIDVHDRDAVINECRKRLKKDPGQWRRLAQTLGALSKTNEIKNQLTKEETGKYSTVAKKYQSILYAPFMISDRCCYAMKKEPLNRYAHETGRLPITAQMASESKLRTQAWLKNGCNAFGATHKVSNPMAFWLEQDVFLYIYQNKIPICSVYGEVVKDTEVVGQMDFSDLGIFDCGRPSLKTTGYDRTGCMLCGFGCHMEKGESRFQRLKKTHPKMYALMDVVKNNGVTFREAIEWTNEHGGLNIKL